MNENGIMPTYDMNRGGFGGEDNWLWIILLLFLFGFGGNGFGGFGHGQQDINDQFLQRDLFGMQQAQSNCCCETNRNIDSVRADAYRNTCDITTAIHAEGEQTRALINANTMQELRDKLSDRDRDLLVAELSFRGNQNVSQIISTLQPTPRPAYLTCSPFASQPCPYGYYNPSNI